jgi:hypothetical protein
MSNSHENKHLTERPALPALVAISLCATMLAFGCTTDRNLGNGTPVVTPGLRTSPTSGPSTGSENAPTPPPMMSSSTYRDGRPIARLSAAEAAAIMADNQPRVRVLGPVAPGNGRAYVSDLAQVGTRVNVPQQYGTSSINSGVNNNGQASAAITSGAGEPIGSADTLAAAFIDANDLGTIFGDTGGTQTGTTGTTTTATGTNVTNAGAPTITPTGTTLTPTGAAVGVPSGTFASVGTLSPTAAAVVNPPASISSSPTLAATSSARTAGRTIVTPATRTATTATNATKLNTTVSATTIAPTTGAAVNPVRIVNTNGRVTVTNTSGNQR